MGEVITNIHCPLCTNKVFKVEKGYQCSCGAEFALDITNKPMSKTTNSLIGSPHWFNTLCGRIRHNTEFITSHTSESFTKECAEAANLACVELIDGYKLINHST